MAMLLLLSIALLAGLLFGANLPPLALLVAGMVIALVFSLGAFLGAKRTRRVV
jgi:hypothetical protein